MSILSRVLPSSVRSKFPTLWKSIFPLNGATRLSSCHYRCTISEEMLDIESMPKSLDIPTGLDSVVDVFYTKHAKYLHFLCTLQRKINENCEVEVWISIREYINLFMCTPKIFRVGLFRELCRRNVKVLDVPDDMLPEPIISIYGEFRLPEMKTVVMSFATSYEFEKVASGCEEEKKIVAAGGGAYFTDFSTGNYLSHNLFVIDDVCYAESAGNKSCLLAIRSLLKVPSLDGFNEVVGRSEYRSLISMLQGRKRLPDTTEYNTFCEIFHELQKYENFKFIHVLPEGNQEAKVLASNALRKAKGLTSMKKIDKELPLKVDTRFGDYRRFGD